MKGLEEAGRVLLMQHGCIRGGSSGGGAGGDVEGTDAEGAESGVGKKIGVRGTGSRGGRAGCREAAPLRIYETVELGLYASAPGGL